MKTTLTITVEKELAEFIRQQPQTIDPSAYINQLIFNDIRNNSAKGQPSRSDQGKVQNDAEAQEMERWMDEQTPAAG